MSLTQLPMAAPTTLALGAWRSCCALTAQQRRAVGVGFALAAAVLWSFWPTICLLVDRWSTDPQYSHGFLVPVFAAIILWTRRQRITVGPAEPLGALLLAASLVPRWFTGQMDLGSFDAVCLLGSLAGMALLVGGRSFLRGTWPAILFLAFMIPLPYSLEQGVAVPLRRFATLGATYVLQALGYPAMAEGNIIQIDQIRMGVIDACSGLGMLMTFFALATLMAVTFSGPLLDRWLLVAGAAPIAVVANILRVTVTGIAFASLGGEEHRETIHDVLGWLMMPLALALLWLEFKFLQLLLVPVADDPLAVPLSPWVDRGRLAEPAARGS